VYCATKFALNAVTKTLRLEVLGTGVRVTSVDPGLVETEFSKVRFRDDSDKAAEPYRGLAPLTAEDVARAVLYAVTQPAHVAVADLCLLPTDQASVADTIRR
jgi:serine 3-dehydrogenase